MGYFGSFMGYFRGIVACNFGLLGVPGNLGYHNPETILFRINPYYGGLGPSCGMGVFWKPSPRSPSGLRVIALLKPFLGLLFGWGCFRSLLPGLLS